MRGILWLLSFVCLSVKTAKKDATLHFICAAYRLHIDIIWVSFKSSNINLNNKGHQWGQRSFQDIDLSERCLGPLGPYRI